MEEDIRIVFSVQTRIGKAVFTSHHDIDDEPFKETLNELLHSWRNKVINVAAKHILAEQVGIEQAQKFELTIYCD
jgi:hypothetical protein